MTMKMRLGAVVMVAVALLWSLPAHASTVSIGLGPNPLLNVVATSPTGTAVATEMSPGFIVNVVSVTGSNPPLPFPQVLGSTSFDIASGPGIQQVWVTSQDNTPVGPSFMSDLTTNNLPAGWTVEMKTWIGPDNAMFGTGTLIGDFTFPGMDTNVQFGSASPANPYSITAEYIITATSFGTANSTIDVFATPEPSSLLLLGTGLLGVGLGLRRKHR